MAERHPTLADRFWSRVRKTEGCWEWQGTKSPSGYGAIWVLKYRRSVGTHRVSWELHNGPIPEGMQVCHHCDNPPCVRPDHLFIGTGSDNALDASRKGRLCRRYGSEHWTNVHPELRVRGERQTTSKLTAKDVEAIRAEPWFYGVNAHLARKYGVDRSNISYIRRGKSWRVVPLTGVVTLKGEK